MNLSDFQLELDRLHHPEMSVIEEGLKRLSALKGGKFAAHCAPARVEAVILSDILGDPLDMIASGPVSPDAAKSADALAIAAKYGLHISPEAEACLRIETPKAKPLTNSKKKEALCTRRFGTTTLITRSGRWTV